MKINFRPRGHRTFASLSCICPKTHGKLFLEADAVLLLLNLTFCILAMFSAPAKRELNNSNDTFLEGDIIRNYGVVSRLSELDEDPP